jgi:hypothetical protein
VLAAVGAIAALVAHFTIVVERAEEHSESDTHTKEPPPAQTV